MQLEVGDMILWDARGDRDIGWIIHKDGDGEELMLYIVWASCGATESIWAQYILNKEHVTIIKGGQDDR